MWHTNPPTPASLRGSVGWPGVADKEDGQFPAISRLYHLHLFLHNSPTPTPTHLISDISYTFIRFYYWGKYNSQGARLNLKNKVISWNKSTKVESEHSARANNTASQLLLSIFLLLSPIFSGEREPASPMPIGNLIFFLEQRIEWRHIFLGAPLQGVTLPVSVASIFSPSPIWGEELEAAAGRGNICLKTSGLQLYPS